MQHANELPTDIEIPQTSLWAKLPIIGAVLAVVGLGITATSLSSDTPDRFYFSYLFGFAFSLSIALGSMAFVILQHITRAGWSAAVRRIGELSMMTIPTFALLFIPIALGAHSLYEWTHTDQLDEILHKKAGYLNTTFWGIRAVVYFAVWSLIAWFLYSRSKAQDNADDATREKLSRAMWKFCAAGIFLFGLSQTFASFDWLMSLQPHWYSTIFGVYFFAGSILAAYSFMTLIAMGLQKAGVLKTAITTEHYHDLGKFVFGHTVFWAYIGFSQFFLIWYANIPEETVFFLDRLDHGWQNVSYALPVVHFALPFLFLLSRHIKRNRTTLAIGATWMLFVHAIDLYWLIMPNFGAHGGDSSHKGFHLSLTDVTALLGVFGIFLAVLGVLMRRNKVIAIGDPRLQESLAHENY